MGRVRPAPERTGGALNQRGSSSNGREHLGGGTLFEQLRKLCAPEPLVGYVVWPTDDADRSVSQRFPGDVIPEAWFRSLDPTLVVLEGGLFEEDGRWRIPRRILEETVAASAVVTVADADKEDFRRNGEHYHDALQSLGTVRAEDSSYTQVTRQAAGRFGQRAPRSVAQPDRLPSGTDGGCSLAATGLRRRRTDRSRPFP